MNGLLSRTVLALVTLVTAIAIDVTELCGLHDFVDTASMVDENLRATHGTIDEIRERSGRAGRARAWLIV